MRRTLRNSLAISLVRGPWPPVDSCAACPGAGGLDKALRGAMRSSGGISTQARPAQSPAARCKTCLPTPLPAPHRLPVMRWPMPSRAGGIKEHPAVRTDGAAPAHSARTRRVRRALLHLASGHGEAAQASPDGGLRAAQRIDPCRGGATARRNGRGRRRGAFGDRRAMLTICEAPSRRALFVPDRNVIACKFQGNSGMVAALPPQAEVAGASASCLRASDLGGAKRGAGRWRASLKTSRRLKARAGLIAAGSCAHVGVRQRGGTRVSLHSRMGSKQGLWRSSGIPMT